MQSPGQEHSLLLVAPQGKDITGLMVSEGELGKQGEMWQHLGKYRNRDNFEQHPSRGRFQEWDVPKLII